MKTVRRYSIIAVSFNLELTVSGIGEPSYAPGSQGGLGADKDTCSFSPQDVAEDDDQGLTVSGMKSEGQEQSDFQDWLQDEMTRHAPTEACRDIAIVVMGKISLSEGVQFPEEALVHPWYNPLNRSRLDGSCLADFASDCAQLPSTGTQFKGSLL